MAPKTIGIIGGKGQMGRYFARFFSTKGFNVIISDKRSKLTNAQLARRADVVIVSVPIETTEAVIQEVATLVKKEALLMDLTSLKVFPMKAMKACKGSYLGCHPLFGPTTSIEGQMIILCKGKGSRWHSWLKQLFADNALDVRELTAQKHDELMAYVQSLTHFSYLGLSDVLRTSGYQLDELLDYQSPIYRLRLDVMGRILDQNPDLYAQIQIQNPNSLKVMKSLMKCSLEWIELVEKGDAKAFKKRFSESASFFGDFTKKATEESDYLIEQMNRRTLACPEVKVKLPDKTCDYAVLGPEFSFSSMAAKKFFPKGKIWYADSITSVFEAVKSGKIPFGLVPIENTTSGIVRETQDALFDSGLSILKEVYLPIDYCLATLQPISLKAIRTVYSHGQPLRQCRKYLQRHCPGASLISLSSSTAAIKKVISENLLQSGVICSRLAADEHKMTIIADKIGDFSGSSTRFLLIGKKPGTIPKSNPKTSIAFYFSTDNPGTLYQVLGLFSDSSVNLNRIESSANPSVPGGYVFSVDFDGSQKDPTIKKLLTDLKKLVKRLIIYGSY